MSVKYVCGTCARRTLALNPAGLGSGSVQWINLLETQVPMVCPLCGPVYSIAKVIAQTDGTSADVKNAAGIVCLVLLVFAAGHLVDKLVSRRT